MQLTTLATKLPERMAKVRQWTEAATRLLEALAAN
jgi:hypothetical protein